MTDKQTQEQGPKGNMLKDPGRMDHRRRTHDFRAALLSQDAFRGGREPFEEHLTKAEASKRIEELQHKTGRGVGTDAT